MWSQIWDRGSDWVKFGVCLSQMTPVKTAIISVHPNKWDYIWDTIF